MKKLLENYQRQVHLDFHTSPHIPDVACEFDASVFARTMKEAHVNSVTVFAKCHHGMCYYPTTTGTAHPALGGRDLLGEQIEALHREGIRAPIYTTVVWEEDVARKFPEWRQMTREGHFAGWNIGPDGKPGHVGMWQFNNFLHPDYQDYIEAHLREILGRYGKEVDGFFLDILFFAENACWSAASRDFRARRGLADEGPGAFERFQGAAQAAFASKFTKIVRGIRRQATLFYNAQNDGNMDPRVGPRARAAWQTHCEIESLPSGFWGYHHFPRMARAQSTWGKPWLGMTGRFQKMWGDFGGIKPQAALEFDCFRAQALGGGNSVGDQLPPRGRLDAAAYRLIGSVYRQCAEAEPFYRGATFVRPRVGIFSASYPGRKGGRSEEGAVLLCEEAHYDCAMLDSLDPLDGYSLLILPDTTVVEPALAKRLATFQSQGGKIMASFCSGFTPQGEWALSAWPLRFEGQTDKFPTYWRARKPMTDALTASDRVFYEAGMNVRPGPGWQVWVDRVLPYFQRTAVTFSSHSQTPPVADPCPHPAVLARPGAVYFADPIFREYRKTGNLAVRQAWQAAVRELIGPPPFGEGLPSTVLVVPLRKRDALLLTLLHYIPVRKAVEVDVIHEPSTFAGEQLKFSVPVESVWCHTTGSALAQNSDGTFALPHGKGRLLLEVPSFFAPAAKRNRRK